MRPTLRQLQYLVAIADTGGVSHAARHLNVTQASLSQQIATMEAELSASLLERIGRGVRPTPLGLEIISHARDVLTAVDQIRLLCNDAEARMPKRLRLGVLPSIGAYFMPLATRRLHSEHPDLRLYVKEGSTDDLLAALLDGRLDMVISTPAPRADIEEIDLFTESLWVCASPDDPLSTSRAPVSIQDLAKHPLLTLGEGFHLSHLVAQIAQAAGTHVSLEYQSGSLDAVRQMAVMGAGVAVLPSLYALGEAVRDPDFVVRLIDDPLARHPVTLQWRRGSPMEAPCQELARHFRAVKARIRQERTDLFAAPTLLEDPLSTSAGVVTLT